MLWFRSSITSNRFFNKFIKCNSYRYLHIFIFHHDKTSRFITLNNVTHILDICNNNKQNIFPDVCRYNTRGYCQWPRCYLFRLSIIDFRLETNVPELVQCSYFFNTMFFRSWHDCYLGVCVFYCQVSGMECGVSCWLLK